MLIEVVDFGLQSWLLLLVYRPGRLGKFYIALVVENVQIPKGL